MDWIINDELGLTVGDVFGGAAACAMVLGGIIPYIPQYYQIKKTQDAEGFSLLVCLALLMANSMRILFWFSNRYELPLLIQSVIMTITMFIMIHLCVKVKRRNAIMRTRDRTFSASSEDNNDVRLRNVPPETTILEGSTLANKSEPKQKHYLSDFDIHYFWQWTDFQSYLDFMLIVWLVGAAVTYIMLGVEWFMETLGFVAVFTEAMLGAPQFIRNFRSKSTHGMSISMVIMWTCGDLFKTGYTLIREAPTQFYICGIMQVCLDLAILLQVYIYRKNVERVSHRGD